MKAITVAFIVFVSALAAGFAHAQGPAAGAPPKFVQPAGPGEKFMDLAVGNVKVLYTEGWTDAARKIAEKTDGLLRAGLAKVGVQQPKSAIEITLRAVVPDDLVLCIPQEQPDLQKSSIRYPIAVPEGGADAFTLDDMRVKGSIQSILNYAFLFDIIASNSDSIPSNPRWFLFGLSTYLGAGAARELAGDDAGKLVQTQWGDKVLENYHDRLLKWTDKKPGPHDKAYVLGCTQMFIEIEKKFGPEAIEKIAAAYAKSPKVDTDSVVKIISEAIGQDFVEFLKSYVSPKHPTLGVIADKTFAGPGVKVLDVQAETCGAAAGFAPGDIIMKVNGEELKDAEALNTLINKAGIGDALKMTVKRGDAEAELNVTLSEPVLGFPPAPGEEVAQGQPQGPSPLTEEEILDAFKNGLKQSGFTQQQIDLMFKYIEGTKPGGPLGVDLETGNKMVEYLKMKGFSEIQARMLVTVFKLDPEGIKKAIAEVNRINEANKDENITPEQLLENLGWPKDAAQLVVMMMRQKGMTDEQIKADIRAGKFQKPGEGGFPMPMPPPNMPLPPGQP